MQDEHENEVEKLDKIEDKAIDQIARFLVFTARDIHKQELETKKELLPSYVIKKSERYAKHDKQ